MSLGMQRALDGRCSIGHTLACSGHPQVFAKRTSVCGALTLLSRPLAVVSYRAHSARTMCRLSRVHKWYLRAQHIDACAQRVGLWDRQDDKQT
jgi:hypothetical protein